MSRADESVHSANPLCPICGATDWVSDTRWNYVLHAVDTETGGAIMATATAQMVTPCRWFICRSCRFIRLQAAAGTLEFSGERERT